MSGKPQTVSQNPNVEFHREGKYLTFSLAGEEYGIVRSDIWLKIGYGVYLRHGQNGRRCENPFEHRFGIKRRESGFAGKGCLNSNKCPGNPGAYHEYIHHKERKLCGTCH